MSDKVLVKRSSISGLGLYAATEFRRGQVIVEYTGKYLLDADPTQNKYLFAISSKWFLDGSPKSNIGRYANHSCGYANAWVDVSKRGRVWLIANKRINPGDEIVYNYGKEYFNEYINGSCKCIACRKRRRERRALGKLTNGRTPAHRRNGSAR